MFSVGRNDGILISADRGVPDRKCQRHLIPWLRVSVCDPLEFSVSYRSKVRPIFYVFFFHLAGIFLNGSKNWVFGQFLVP